jgi:multidrug resistance protein MdtO
MGVLVAIVIAMTLRVPGIALALALLYLMQRERPGHTLRVGLQIFAGAVVACIGSIFWVQLTDGTDVARFLGVLLCIFISAFCMAGTTIPLFWTITAFYGFVDLAAWDAHHAAGTVVTSSLYNVASLGIVVLSAAAVEYLFGTKHPAEDLEHEMQMRLMTIRDFFSALAESTFQAKSHYFVSIHRKLINLAHAGDLYLNELYGRLRDSLPDSSELPLGIHYRIGLLTRILNTSVFLGFHLPQGDLERHQGDYLAIANLCDDFLTSQKLTTQAVLSAEAPQPLRDIYRELKQYTEVFEEPYSVPGNSFEPMRESIFTELFLPGAFDSPQAVLYALKLTLAAAICYVIYNAIAWPGILTCVVTVLFTGLSSTGAMKQKQLYRFSGAAIGGIIAIITVSVFYPNMDSITSLVVLVAPVAFLSGWIMRSPLMSYIGVQIGFGFFLTALPGFGAATQISPARDRVIGVALGILVMWFIFDQLWPVRTTDTLRASLTRIQKATVELQQLLQTTELKKDSHTFLNLRGAVSQELMNVQQLGFAVNFEAGRHRRGEIARTRRLMAEIDRSSAEFYSAAIRVYES